MNYKKIFYSFCCLLMSLAVFAGNGETPLFTVANTLQSNMVVQQKKKLMVWGNATAGTKINIRASWHKSSLKTTTNAQGIWQLPIPVPGATPGMFTQNTLRISSGSETILLKNILIGDVWLCGGQSNMDMEIKPFLPWLLGAMHYRQEIENAAFPQIRLFNVRTDFKSTPQADCGGNWMVCSPATAPDFSALAYFFAREVFNRTQIPIGLVVSSVGGSSCQAWISRDSLTSDKALYEKYLFPYDTSSRSKEALDSVVTFEKVVRPSLFYNAMIYPLRNIQFKGALWYQGESNRYDSSVYTRLCAAMIGNWRELFTNKNLPFYYVQVAPYNWQQNDPTLFEYALLREAQANIRKEVANTEMAVTMDIADPTDIHPRNKQDLGWRLAKIALANDYHFSNTIFKGPEYAYHLVVKDTLKIHFKYTGSGLTTNDGAPPRHFFIAGKDGVFYPATATVHNNEIWLYSGEVKQPVAIRYAFTNYPVTNLENKEGFPAVPFRSLF